MQNANDNFSALRTYRNAPQHVPGPLQSNWSLVASDVPDLGDDARQEDKDSGVTAPRWKIERRHEILPSISGMFRALGKPTRVYCVTTRGPKGTSKTTAYREWTPPRGQVTKWGKLKFSNGETTEVHPCNMGDGTVELLPCEMPKGALLGCKVEATKPRGGASSGGLANGKFIELLMGKGTPNHPYVPKGDIRPGKSFTAAESRAIIADAIGNTPTLPAVTVCPPGVAAGTPRYSEQFNGTRTVATKGKGGAIGWVEFYIADRDRKQLVSVIECLPEETVIVLEAALTAANFAEVGVAAGQSREYARSRGGKLVLQAANDNLAKELKKLAA